MKENLLKYIIFLFGSTFFLAEISTRIFIPQPVFTPRTYQHSDGLRTNKNSGSSVHSYFGQKINMNLMIFIQDLTRVK